MFQLSSLRFASRMKLVTTEPAVNEKYDAEVLGACGQPLMAGGGGRCCPGHTGLASLPASTKDVIQASPSPFQDRPAIRAPDTPVGLPPGERARSGASGHRVPSAGASAGESLTDS